MVDSRQIERLFSAYTGSEAFLFVCYSHDDADAIYPELQWLHDQGMNVWYDEGISAGKNWRSEIGDSLLKADYFLFYISKASLRSEHCNREINLALDERKKIIPIYLENVELTSDLKVGLSRVQALFNTDKKYQQLLLNALGAQGAARAASSKPSSYMDQSIQPTVKKTRKTISILALVSAVAVMVVALIVYNQRTDQQPPESATDQVDLIALHSIAVLPFARMGTTEQTASFTAGLSRDILDNLGEFRNIKVASPSTLSQLTEGNQDYSSIGKRLKVAYLLAGSVRQQASVVHIAVQLIRTEDGFQVWSNTYPQNLASIFETQTAVAANITYVVRKKLKHDIFRNHGWKQQDWLVGIDPTAVQHFINARREFGDHQVGEGGSLLVYIQLLKNAVEADSKFYRAHISISNIYFAGHRHGRFSLQEARLEAHAAINKALAIAPQDLLPYDQLPLIHLALDLDYARAEAGFDQSFERNPGSVWHRIMKARLALREGRTSDALQQMRNIPTFIPGYFETGNDEAGFHTSAAWIFSVSGDYDAALKANDRALKLALWGDTRGRALEMHALSLVGSGRLEEARPFIEEGWNLMRNKNPAPYIALFASIGDVEQSRSILSDSRYDLVGHFDLARGYLALEDFDNTFNSIAAGIENQDQFLLESLIVADWWDPIRDDPRFDEMLELLDSKVTHTLQYQRDHN